MLPAVLYVVDRSLRLANGDLDILKGPAPQPASLGIIFFSRSIGPRFAEKLEGMTQPSRAVEPRIFRRMNVNIFPVLNSRLLDFPNGAINCRNRIPLMRADQHIAWAMLQAPACIPQVGQCV